MTILSYNHHALGSVSGTLIPGSTVILSTLPSEFIAVGDIKIEIEAIQSGSLGPANNLEVFINDISHGKILLANATNIVNGWSSYVYFDEPITVAVKTVSSSLLTTYSVAVNAYRVDVKA